MSGGKDCRTQNYESPPLHQRRHINAWNANWWAAEDNQHNTEIAANKVTVSFIVITMEEEDDKSCKRDDIRDSDFPLGYSTLNDEYGGTCTNKISGVSLG